MKTQQLSWRSSHPYILADRFEDVTPPERVHANSKCDRNITLYGYLRGSNMKRGTKVLPSPFDMILLVFSSDPYLLCFIIFPLFYIK